MRCSWLRCFMRVAVQAIGWKGSDSRGAESGALPSGCHEAAVPAGTAREEEEGDGIEFSKNLRLVRGKVASRNELSHEPCMSSIPAASTNLLLCSWRVGRRVVPLPWNCHADGCSASLPG